MIERLAARPLQALEAAPDPAGRPGAPGFSGHLRAALVEANQRLLAAEESARALAEGRGDIAETMIALSQAELSLRQVVTLRNRVLESYQEIMRLQL
jgi:flagellar hook-basal body complex protein FliE